MAQVQACRDLFPEVSQVGIISATERMDLADKVQQYRREQAFEFPDEVQSNQGSDAGSENSEASRRSLRNLSNLRERHTRALDALRRGSRSAAVALACRQNPGPASSSNEDFGKSHFEDPPQAFEEPLFQDSMSTSLTADPLVTAVRGISRRHIQEYANLHAKVQELREEAAQHRGALCQVVQAHSEAINSMRPTVRRPCFAILKIMMAAFGFTYGVVLGLETVAEWKLPGFGAAYAIPASGKTKKAFQLAHLPRWELGRYPRQQQMRCLALERRR